MLVPILAMIFTVAEAEAPAAAPPSVLFRVAGRSKGCRIRVDGTRLRLPRDAVRLEAMLRPLAAQGAVADFTHIDKDADYHCIAKVIEFAQRAGLTYSRIGFISEPDPTPEADLERPQ